jgi:hypothetical protein
MRRAIMVSIFALGACGCVDTGQERVSVPLYLAGSELGSPLSAAGDTTLTIDSAELAFGPLYFCAGNTAGELCDTARLEWLDARVIDLTRETPERAGELSGVSGPVRSFMYDLGISSQLTRDQPYTLAAARELEGASFRVSGSASIAGVELPFRAQLAVQQTEGTEPGVPVIRKSTSERFSHDVGADESGVLIRFDASSWLRSVDLRGYLEDDACSADGPEYVCAGQLEQRCTSDGTVSETRDCSALGQVCLAAKGCSSELVFETDSEPYRALRNGLLAGGRPTFEWGFVP